MSAVESTTRNQTSESTTITNARIVTPDGIIKNGTVSIRDGVIEKIESAPADIDQKAINASSQYLLPGFIDLHCDAIEKVIQPRPGGQFPIDAAISEFDKRLAGSGVTTMCHCVCFMEENENEIRSWNMAEKIARRIKKTTPQLAVRNWIHARLEITVADAVPKLQSLIQKELVHLLSFMDHSPGQGQFTSHKHFREYYSQARKLPEEEVQKLANQRIAAKKTLGDDHLRELARICREKNIPLASHDDDTPEKVEWMNDIGVCLSEFPVRLDAARHAQRLGMNVLMGAPNVLRGHSLTDNLSGRHTIEQNCCDVMASDFAPMSLLHAVFTLAGRNIKPLHEMVNMVSLNPASVLGMDERLGSVKVGRAADLILVDTHGNVPRVTKTFVSGQLVHSFGA